MQIHMTLWPIQSGYYIPIYSIFIAYFLYINKVSPRLTPYRLKGKKGVGCLISRCHFNNYAPRPRSLGLFSPPQLPSGLAPSPGQASPEHGPTLLPGQPSPDHGPAPTAPSTARATATQHLGVHLLKSPTPPPSKSCLDLHPNFDSYSPSCRSRSCTA
jgi:hypothetical protein